MKFAKNRIAAIAIAIFLMLSMSASMMLVPTANAHTPAWQIPTYAYIIAGTNPVGVGQTVNVIMWLDSVIAGAAAANDVRFHNYNLTITKPDGTKETRIFDTVQDTTSSQGYSFTPDQTGNYTLTFNFPGQVYTYTELISSMFGGSPAQSDYINDTYLPSSATTTLTVQQQPITAITSYPLPTEYWTRPIYGENTDWWSISSNWLGSSSPQLSSSNGYNLYVSDGVGSQTSHIMWTKALQSGGVVGGNDFAVQGDTYFDGTAYSIRYQNPIILDGMLYYTEPISVAGSSSGPTDCVNLQTGQLIWSRTDVPALSFGYIYDMQNMNYHGVWSPILIATSGTTWRGYDADTGDALFNVTNVPSGTKAMGPNGEYMIYVITNAGTAENPQYYLGEWNSSKIGYGAAGGGLSTGAISGTVDGSASSNYDWNVSIPWANTMTPGAPSMFGPGAIFTVVAAYDDDIMLCYNGSLPAGYATLTFAAASSAPYTYFGVQLNATKGTVGSVLWWNTLSAPSGNITVTQGGVDPVNRVFLEGYNELRQWVGYSLDTGAKLWGPTASQGAMDYYGTPGNQAVHCQIAYGKAYSSEFSGIIYCYDVKTGDLLWTYGNGGAGNSTTSGFYTGEGNYPTSISAIGNGVIYTVTTEHTVTTPIYKGALTRAINATDGTEIYTLSAYTGEFTSICFAIADGYTNYFNGYDNQIYTLGRGPSATTVEAPKASIELGRSLVISGTVTDTSSGTTQNQQAADFPNGVPVASDASMSAWMGYVYQQKPLPTNFTGVPVSIDVLDSNGNYRTIGTATTDATGMYSLSWKPDITGNFTVVATFHGTNGYWPSYSETSFVVDPAAPTASPYPVVNLPPTEMYIGAAAAAIIVAIAIVGVLILTAVRKRP
jgi:hypothetical protein